MSDKKNTGSLISTLLEVQQDLSHAKASATNPHFKSQYVPFEALWDYAKEHLNGKGILIQQISHESFDFMSRNDDITQKRSDDNAGQPAECRWY